MGKREGLGGQVPPRKPNCIDTMLEQVIVVVSLEIDLAEKRHSLETVDNVAGGEVSSEIREGLFEWGEDNKDEKDTEGGEAQYAHVSPRLLIDLDDMVDPVGGYVENEQ
ncbi:hypothetical protein NDU88_002149 [Pleurodeles waltl]|uniref:Uncharacterized protein n=1 Tax=Pleurodeles waltl TaxID=8319 RepID=A0AAV7NEM1_PLEWA|nr:hypothetical protein NDU88_002149 [Pleurodeles waltl]